MDLGDAWKSVGGSVADLFDRPGEAFVVPRYQRDYTWEEENVNQLFDDLVLGLQELAREGGDDATMFLGTSILTPLDDTTDVVLPGEERAKPTAVQVVIDGQQRIATIALIAIVLAERINSLCRELTGLGPYKALRDHGVDVVGDLKRVYAVRLGRGAEPAHKPKVIREAVDQWTYSGGDQAYKSPIARYIATYIRTTNAGEALAAIGTGVPRVRRNIELIDRWLDDICGAHVPGSPLHGQFPSGASAATSRMQKYVLGYSDATVGEIVGRMEVKESERDWVASAAYHVFLLTYYLLRRCGVNRLQAKHEEWGFDMFQALNATGTPLTAMETFLPQVMAAEKKCEEEWDTSPSAEYMAEVDRLFEGSSTNRKKSQRTNDLLRTFALCQDGKKLGNRFSSQRRWLSSVYRAAEDLEERRSLVRNLAEVARFYRCAWYMEECESPSCILGLEKHPQGELASLLVQYLKKASSRLSAPILARFYSQAVLDPAQQDQFVDAAKACAAFFTLWRSARSTSGLDDVYRRFYQGSGGPVGVGKHTWSEMPGQIAANGLKEYFRSVLEDKEIATKDLWMNASRRFLLYSEVKAVCRFVLFVGGHDRVANPDRPGLTTEGTVGTCPLLELGRWRAKSYKSIEHVAPQRPRSAHGWDPKIYSEGLADELGNLLLLPTDINGFADNRDWAVKFLYYSHVGDSRARIERAREEAERRGIRLRANAIRVLRTAEYSCVVAPVLDIGVEGGWDSALIDRRTRQIKEIAWKSLNSWLET